MKNFRTTLKKQLKNEEFKKEYDELESWYQVKKSLIEARINAGLTQEQMAKKIGIKQSNLSRFEKLGLNSKLETVIKYAKALGMKELKIDLQN